MSRTDFTLTFFVDQTPSEVFICINNVRGWWSTTLEGNSEKLNDEFVYRHKDFHYSKQKLIEVAKDKKIVWLVTDSKLTFVKTTNEWNGTKIIFDITTENDKTKLVVTHEGLVPEFECFNDCSKGWTYYLSKSLLPLINDRKGKPD